MTNQRSLCLLSPPRLPIRARPTQRRRGSARVSSALVTAPVVAESVGAHPQPVCAWGLPTTPSQTCPFNPDQGKKERNGLRLGKVLGNLYSHQVSSLPRPPHWQHIQRPPSRARRQAPDSQSGDIRQPPVALFEGFGRWLAMSHSPFSPGSFAHPLSSHASGVSALDALYLSLPHHSRRLPRTHTLQPLPPPLLSPMQFVLLSFSLSCLCSLFSVLYLECCVSGIIRRLPRATLVFSPLGTLSTKKREGRGKGTPGGLEMWMALAHTMGRCNPPGSPARRGGHRRTA
jgi:hypothetical protein